jgi:hypothetical protein
MAAVTYNTESLIAGSIQTDQVYLAADTYYKGMLLTYDANNNYWVYDATPGAADTGVGIYLGDSVSTSRLLSSAGYGTIIKGGDVQEGGFVNDSGNAVTLDEDIISVLGTFGIYVKRA